MNIIKSTENDTMFLKLEGRLDTNTAPQLEEELNSSLPDIKELVLDFKSLMYVSSAGLRVILSAQKMMLAAGGNMAVRNVNESVMDIFEMTGFTGILTIQ